MYPVFSRITHQGNPALSLSGGGCILECISRAYGAATAVGLRNIGGPLENAPRGHLRPVALSAAACRVVLHTLSTVNPSDMSDIANLRASYHMLRQICVLFLDWLGCRSIKHHKPIGICLIRDEFSPDYSV